MFGKDEIQQELTQLLEVQGLSIAVETNIVPADVSFHLSLVVEEDCLEVSWPCLTILDGGVVPGH